MTCSKCGATMKAGEKFCGRCGASIKPAEIPPVMPTETEAFWEETEKSQQDIFGFMYCRKCKTRSVDRSENPNSVLCRQCREESIHYPIPKGLVVVGIIILAMLLLSFIKFPTSLKYYKTIEGAERKAANGYIYSTLVELDTIAGQISSNSVPMKIVNIAMEYGYYNFASYAIDTYLAGEEVSDSEYEQIENYFDELERYYNTCDACEEIINSADYANENVENEIIIQICTLMEEQKYDIATLYYYLGYIASDDSDRCAYFEACYSMEPTYTDAAAQVANSYRRKGDLVKAREFLEEAYRIDREASATLRGLAIVESLDGNLSKGLSFAEEAYRLNEEGDYVADTYIVVLAASGNIEGAQSIKDSLEQEGYQFEEDVQDFLDGKVTLEEYYIGEL